MAHQRDPKRPYPHDIVLAWCVLPLIPRSVTPNMVTVFRLLTTPLVLWLLIDGQYGWGTVAFAFVAFTDAIDGTMARMRHQITPWGTFYDPIADKLLIVSVMLAVILPTIPAWLAYATITVEVLITLGGFVRRRRGRPVSANIFGKTKMFLQCIGVGLVLLSLALVMPSLMPFAIGCLWVSIGFAVVSLLTYGL